MRPLWTERAGAGASIGFVHVRRALLLFAIVLGLAALAASMSRPRDEQSARNPPPATATSPDTQATPEASPGETPTELAATADTIAFDAEQPRRRGLEAGRAASVEVAVDQPGLVSIPLLGESAAADEFTPARFDVLVNQEGRYPIEFAPAAGDEERRAGTLVVKQPSR
jgi:hypothetical protein